MTSSDDDALLEGFHDLPNEKQRSRLSVVQLADLLASLKPGSLPFIVLSHELNAKIAERQATIANRGIKIAGAFTILGSLLGAWANSWFTAQPAAQVVKCECGPNGAAISAQPVGTISQPLSSAASNSTNNIVVVPTSKPTPNHAAAPQQGSGAKK